MNAASERRERRKIWYHTYHQTENGKKKEREWVENQNIFADKHCVLCGGLLIYRKTKRRVCKKCWLTKVHPMLVKMGVYKNQGRKKNI